MFDKSTAEFFQQVPGAEQFAGGIHSQADWDAFVKAIQSSGDPNVLDSKGSLTGSPAIRRESLEGTLRAITERDESFKLHRRLHAAKANSMIEEWSTRTSIGGDVGDAFQAELGDVQSNITNWKRDILRLKTLATRYEVGYAAQRQDTLASLEAEERKSAVTRILRSAEWAHFHGNESVNPHQYDGLATKLAAEYPSHVMDFDGSSDTEQLFGWVYESFARAVGQEGGYSTLTDLFVTPLVQSDLDMYLDPQYRVAVQGDAMSVEYGAPVLGIKTTFGSVRMEQDSWIEEADHTNLTMPATARMSSLHRDAPTAPTLTATNASAQTGSSFNSARAGTYYYAVAALNEYGEGELSSIDSATVSDGEGIKLTITPPGGHSQTGYAIYRSTQDPDGAPGAADLRLVKRIPNETDSNSTTEFIDKNDDIPGSSTLFLLRLDRLSLAFKQLIPVSKFPLYPTSKLATPSAAALIGALQISVPQHHWIAKNYVPTKARWRAHT